MRPFEFVIALVAIVLTFRAFTLLVGRSRHSRQRLDEQEQYVETQSRIAGLEDRVRVLERIVTDTKADLKSQFRDLE
jgi:hypothetical protein